MIGEEIDLMLHYPKAKRNVTERVAKKTELDRQVARQFGKEFFDGSRDQGYGGYHYHPRFWQEVVKTFKEKYQLSDRSSVLDIGCAKGFMMFDLATLIPGIFIKGIDVSSYAIENALEEMKPHCQIANATDLPFDDHSFDLVISITTLHNLEGDDLVKAIKEIERVKRKSSFITLDAYRDPEEKERMQAWNLTAKTMMHVDEWKRFFQEVGYTGDYYWFIP